jgi:hypothetical protein
MPGPNSQVAIVVSSRKVRIWTLFFGQVFLFIYVLMPLIGRLDYWE